MPPSDTYGLTIHVRIGFSIYEYVSRLLVLEWHKEIPTDLSPRSIANLGSRETRVAGEKNWHKPRTVQMPGRTG